MLLYYDNTRISTYRECNRKFYLRHILNLTHEGESVDLKFGGAWHEAMDVVWREVPKGTPPHHVRDLAAQAFIKYWIEAGFPAPTGANYQNIIDKWPTKNPYVAIEMIGNYIDQRIPFIKDCTEIEIERPFAIPLGMSVTVNGQSEEVFYIGRLDKIVKHRAHGRIIVEHKTTGWYAKEGGFRSDYIESFSPNSQVDGYLFAGNSLVEGGVKALLVDAALAHKTVHDKFKFIPIDRSFAALDAWLAETQTYVKRMAGEIDVLETTGGGGKTFTSFPRNTSSCHVYSGCAFRDICKYIPDPRDVELPSGYKVEPWQPFDILKIAQIMERKGD